jgi:hypothetical protein
VTFIDHILILSRFCSLYDQPSGNHWILAVMNVKESTIYIYDSLSEPFVLTKDDSNYAQVYTFIVREHCNQLFFLGGSAYYLCTGSYCFESLACWCVQVAWEGWIARSLGCRRPDVPPFNSRSPATKLSRLWHFHVVVCVLVRSIQKFWVFWVYLCDYAINVLKSILSCSSPFATPEP